MLKYVNNIQLSVVVRFQRGICFCLKKKVVFIHCISVLQLKRFTADLIMQLTSLKVHFLKKKDNSQICSVPQDDLPRTGS